MRGACAQRALRSVPNSPSVAPERADPIDPGSSSWIQEREAAVAGSDRGDNGGEQQQVREGGRDGRGAGTAAPGPPVTGQWNVVSIS